MAVYLTNYCSLTALTFIPLFLIAFTCHLKPSLEVSLFIPASEGAFCRDLIIFKQLYYKDQGRL